MKTFRKWNHKYIEDWCTVCSTDCKAFYRAFKNYLKRCFPKAEIIGFKAVHYWASGFVKMNGKCIYICHYLNRGSNGAKVDFDATGCTEGVLYREAKDEKDYKGGSNNFTSINDLANRVQAMFNRMGV